MTHNRCLHTCNFPLEDPIRFIQTPNNAEIYFPFKVVHTIGFYTIFFVHDDCFIPVDRQIPFGCNTFLWGSRASSHDQTWVQLNLYLYLITIKYKI